MSSHGFVLPAKVTFRVPKSHRVDKRSALARQTLRHAQANVDAAPGASFLCFWDIHRVNHGMNCDLTVAN
jgi:hypothetical protein